MWASRSKWPKPPTPRTLTPTRSPLEPGSPFSRGRRGQGATTPLPLPLTFPPPPPQQHVPPFTPQDRTNRESPEEPGQGERETQGEVTGQRSPKIVQSAEGGKGTDKRERIIVVVRSPCQENYAQMHTPARTSQCWSWQTQHGLGVCMWMHLVNGPTPWPRANAPPHPPEHKEHCIATHCDTTTQRLCPHRPACRTHPK